jgi:hypothetical protein
VLCALPGDTLTWNVALDVGLELKGRVVDERGVPLRAQVDVHVEDGTRRPHARTDDHGRFTVPRCPDLPCRIEVRTAESGAFPWACIDDARPGQGEILITVRAADLPAGFITGTVVGPDAAPCTGIGIRPTSPDHRASSQFVADPNTAAFRVGPLPPGTWLLTIQAPGCASLQTKPKRLEQNETWDLGTLRLQQPGVLEIQAERSDGSDLASLVWQIASDRGVPVTWAHLRSGSARVETLAPGRYVLQATGEQLAHALHPFEIVARQLTRLEVRMEPALSFNLSIATPPADRSRRVRVIVRDAAGKPVADQWLQRAWETKPFEGTLGLRPGSYRAEAESDAGSAGTFELGIVVGATQNRVRWQLR